MSSGSHRKPRRHALVAAMVALTMAPLSVALRSEPSGAFTEPSTVEAWIYPASTGSPACDVPQELASLAAHPIAVLKPEYFYVANDGAIIEETVANGTPCNGFSTKNLAKVRTAAKSVLVTVSASGSALVTLLAHPNRRAAGVAKVADFVKEYGLNGADIDFEPNSVWSTSQWSDFLRFLRSLKAALPSSDEVEADLFAWTSTPTDATRYGAVAAAGAHVVVMAYDDEYNTPCAAIAPFSWLRQVVRYSQSQVPPADLTIGLPAYGYTTSTCSRIGNVNDNLAYTVMERYRGFPKTAAQRTADRDPGSGELRWRHGRTLYDLVDSAGLDAKVTLVESLGVQDISVWSLGGQSWFDRNPS